MKDRYATCAQLLANTSEGIDWRIISRDRPSTILVVAPHGGRAEPHTSGLAKAIAGKQHSLYIFEALVPGLHITSHKFDEPRAIRQVNRHIKAVTVHGCEDKRSRSIDIFVGGRDRPMRDHIINQLVAAGFQAAVDKKTTGRALDNICNRCSSGAGVQLEITRRLRNRLANQNGRVLRRRFAKAVRCALEGHSA